MFEKSRALSALPASAWRSRSAMAGASCRRCTAMANPPVRPWPKAWSNLSIQADSWASSGLYERRLRMFASTGSPRRKRTTTRLTSTRKPAAPATTHVGLRGSTWAR